MHSHTPNRPAKEKPARIAPGGFAVYAPAWAGVALGLKADAFDFKRPAQAVIDDFQEVYKVDS